MSFNRAADYYDATRGLPEQVRTALADVLAAELAGASRCLEVGVGTGRIALPLHERGVRIVGSDIAPTVLARLVANAGGVAPFPLVCADATRLPFRPAVYDAVLFCHVLHLVTDWRAAVDEARRMLRPGVSDPATVAAYLSVDAEPLPPVPMTVRRALAEDLEAWEQQLYSWTWLYSAEQMQAVSAEVRATAAERKWPVEEPAEMEHLLRWWRFRLT